MNFRLTLALVIVLLFVLSGYIAFQRWGNAGKKEEPGTANALLKPKPDALASIAYKEENADRIAFAKKDNTWTMTYPLAAPVETWSVDRIADTLTGLTFKEKFDPEPTGIRSPETTGTASPRHVITFADDKGKQYTLALGNQTVGGIYATLNGEKTIYLLSDNPLTELDKDPAQFRNKLIKQIPSEKIVGLVVKHKDQTVSLKKTGDNWLIDAPISARANTLKVEEVLNEMKSIRATEFVDLDKNMPATRLNPPIMSVTALVAGDTTPEPRPAASQPASRPAPTPVTLEIGYFADPLTKTERYASLAGSSEVFTIATASFDKLNKQLADLRDPSITPAAVAEATNVKITTAGRPTLQIDRKDGEWNITGSAAAVKGGELEVGNLLGDISHLRAINYVDNAGDLKAIGLAPPQATIELTVPGQSQHEIILIGKPEPDGKTIPMMRQGEPTVYLVPAADAEKLLATPLSLRDKSIERLSSDRIQSITIAGPAAGPSAAVMEREGATWKVKAAGKSLPAADDKITTLLSNFTPLSAAKYLSESPDVSGAPDITVTITALEFPSRAPTTSPATASAPAMGPELGRPITRTLKLYKPSKDNQATWKALWDGPAPQWTFEPSPDLITHLTRETYAIPSTQPATQSSTQPATAPTR